MSDKPSAFNQPIPEGLVRILLKIDSIQCEVENNAPDFISVKEDKPRVKVSTKTESGKSIEAFQKEYPLVINRRKSKDDLVTFELESQDLWFDIKMEEVKDIWIEDFNFYLLSENPRYLAYYIRAVDHKVEWLQTDKNGEIKSLSEFKKSFTPPKISGKETFSGSDVLKCADMLGRSIQKIDLRTGGAYVKFNTEQGRLEPLIMGIAEKLGYKISSLDEKTIKEFEKKSDRNVSHSIFLKEWTH